MAEASLFESELTMVPVGTYMRAQEQPLVPGRKTRKWHIYSRGPNRLGVIEWWGAWRQYVFVPDENTIFSAGCMRDLIEFMSAIRRSQ